MAHTTNFEKHTTANPISRFFLNNFSKVLVNEVRDLTPESILDVGAGEGFTLNAFKQNNVGKRLEGIEYMDGALKLAKKLHPNISIKKGDIYALPYKDDAFDVVICTEVLEHLEKPQRALQELKRVAKKYIVLSVPNEPYFTIQRFLRGKNIRKLGDHPEHIQHWTSGAFKLFVGKELHIKDVVTPLPWTMIVAEK